LALALVDGWMHEKDRKVPPTEQWFHGGILLFVGGFVVAAFLGQNTVALVALVLAIPCLAIDEFRFHGGLAVQERTVHYLADFCLAGFVCLWLITAFT
jgi:hypothetical protein